MRVQDVLARHGSSQALREALQAMLSQGERLELDEGGLRALSRELHDLQSTSPAEALENLKLAELLLKASLDDGQASHLSPDLKQVLLEPQYVEALVGLLRGVTDALARGAGQLSEEHEASLEAVIDAVSDLAEMTGAESAGGGKAKRGRDLHGRQVVPALASFLLLPDPRGELVPVKRSVSTTLVDFILNSKANCGVLAALPESEAPLFGDLLASCGDVVMQIDLLEALYRCARAGVLRPQHRAALRPGLLEAVDALTARGKGAVDLPSELRKLLVPFNRQLGAEATVFSVQAKSLTINGIDGLAGPGRWVDFGTRALGVGVSLPEGEDEEEPEPPELVLFPYDQVTRVQTSQGTTSGYTKLTVSVQELPQGMQTHSQTFKGKGTLVMQLSRGELSGLASHAPRVAAAMKAAGLMGFLGEGALSGGGLGDGSQRGRKVSTGVTIYDASKAVSGAGAGGSSGRAPLPLTRSGHRPPIPPAPSTSNHTGTTGQTGRSGLKQQQQQQQQNPARRPLSLLRHGSAAAPQPGAEHPLAPAQEQQQQERQRSAGGAAGQQAQEAAAVPAAVAADGAAQPASRAAEAAAVAADAAAADAKEAEEAAAAAAAEAAAAQAAAVAAQAAAPEDVVQPTASEEANTQRRRASQHRFHCHAPTGGTRTTQTAAQAAQLADGEVNSPEALLEAAGAAELADAVTAAPAAAAAIGKARAVHRGVSATAGAAGKGATVAGKGAVAGRESGYDTDWSSEGEEEGPEKGGHRRRGQHKDGEEEAPSPALAAKQRAERRQKKADEAPSPAVAAKQRAQQHKQQKGVRLIKEGQKAGAAAGRQKAGLGAMQKKGAGAGGKAAARCKVAQQHGGRGGRGGKGPSPEDLIEETGPEASGKQGVSPTPSWMHEQEGEGKGKAAALLPAGSEQEEDSDSELLHDHASRQPLFKKQQQAATAAAGKGKLKGKAAADTMDEEQEENEETDDSEDERRQPPGRGQQQRQAASKKAAAAAACKPTAAGAVAGTKKQAAAGAPAGGGKKAGGAAASKPAAGKAAAAALKRPLRAGAATAAAKTGKQQAGAQEEEEEGEEFEFSEESGGARGAQVQVKKKKPAAAGGLKAKAAAGGGRQQPHKHARSPLAAMKAIGKKRERWEEEEEEEEAPLEDAHLGADVGPVPGYHDVEELPVVLPLARGGSKRAAAAAAAAVDAEAEAEEEEGLEVEEEEEEAAAMGKEEEVDDELEEGEGGSQEQHVPLPAAYRSEGTHRLQGWTNFRPAEAEVPDMLVAEEELRGITKRFKFTALKERDPGPAGSGAGPSRAAAAGTAGGARRSKAELKAAAAAGGMGKTGPTTLLGLSNAKPARLTTTLSREGLAPSGAAAAGRGAAAKGKGKQQQLQPAAAAVAAGQSADGGGAGKAAAAGGKRALEALGQLSAGKQKRQRPGADSAAPAGGSRLAVAGGPRGTRKAPSAAAAAAAAAAGAAEPAEESQPLSIHHLLQNVQRRRATSTPAESDSEEEDGDLVAVQSFLVEMVRKKKANVQKKQMEMVEALEREAGEAVAAQEKEQAAAQQRLGAQLNQKFAGLEKQLDAKMREIDGAALAFQQQLNTLWEEYRLLYDRVSSSAAEAKEAAGKQRAAAARSIEAVREGLAAKAADVSARIERSSRKAGKMPELAQVLLPFLD